MNSVKPMKKESEANRWLVLSSSIIGMSAGPSQLAFGSLGLFIAPLSAEFAWDRAEIGLAATFFTATLLFSLPAAGKLADKIGARTVLLPSIAVVGIGLAAIPAFVREIWQFWLIFALIGGLGAGANALPYMRAISGWFNRRRGLAIGLTLAGAGFGYTYIPPLLQVTMDQFSWRAAYYLLAALCLLVALPITTLLFYEPPATHSNQPAPPASQESENTPALTRNEALAGSIFWRLFFIFGLLSFSLYGLLVHNVPMLTDRGMSSMSAAKGASIVGLAIMFSRVIVGHLCDRIFAPHVAAAAFALSAVGLCFLASGITGTSVYIALALIGFSIGAEIDMMTFLTTRYYGLKHFGEIYGILFASLLIGTSLGPYWFGASFEKTGSYIGILWIAALLTGIATMTCLTLPPFTRKHGAPHDRMD